MQVERNLLVACLKFPTCKRCEYIRDGKNYKLTFSCSCRWQKKKHIVQFANKKLVYLKNKVIHNYIILKTKSC